ncbi:MAG: alpha-glucan family phosphorylase, partial [Nitrospiraceae bacterium]
LLDEQSASGRPEAAPAPSTIDGIREQCVFTTHTPVPAGHDQFPGDLARRVLGERLWGLVNALGQDSVLNMTELA